MAGAEAACPAPPAPPQHAPLEGDGEDPRPPVLLLRPLLFPLEGALSERFRLLKAWEAPVPRYEFLAAHAKQVTVVLCSAGTRIDAETIASLPTLRCVLTTSIGVDHIDLAECRRRGISVANAGTMFSEDTADYAVGILIDVLRRISAANRDVRRGLWSSKGEHPLGSKLSGKRIGIIGLGSIGCEIAKRLEAFGCLISYNSRTKKPSVPYSFFPNACKLASHSDILIAACELNRETFHIINKDVLAALGKHGVIINIGRGALIDEKELVRFLMEGEIGGVGLDVFENEPDVPAELFQMDNVVLSPHRAVFTLESTSALLDLLTANLKAFFSGRSLLTPVL